MGGLGEPRTIVEQLTRQCEASLDIQQLDSYQLRLSCVNLTWTRKSYILVWVLRKLRCASGASRKVLGAPIVLKILRNRLTRPDAVQQLDLGTRLSSTST